MKSRIQNKQTWMFLFKAFRINIVKNTFKGMVILGCLGLFLVVTPNKALAIFSVDTAFSVSSTFTDNLFFTGANRKEDFGTFVSPLVALTYRDENIILNGVYRGTAQFFVNNPGGNTFVQNTNFGIGLPFLSRKLSRNLEVRLLETFNFSPQLPAFALGGDAEALSNINLGSATPKAGGVGGSGGGIGAGGGSILAGAGLGGVGGSLGTSGGFSGGLDNNGAFTNRSTNAFQNLAGVRMDYAATPKVDLRADYRHRFIKFSGSGLQDSQTHTVQGGISINVTPNTQVQPNYRIQVTKFPGAGNVITHRAMLFLSQQFTPRLRANLNNGVALTQGDVNFNSNTLLAYNYSKGLISLRFTQDIRDGSGLAASATLTQNAVGQFTRSFGRDLVGFLLFGYGNNRSLSGSTIDLTTYQVRTGFSLGILSWLSGFATYSYINQDSSGTAIGGITAQSNQVFLGVTAVADTWRPFK